jgi:poly [ADP-ribose] polymerase 10/14/15
MCNLQILRTFVKNVLNEAFKRGVRSIAFPAIGSGNLKFPPDVVAASLFETVDNFSARNARTSISEVRFVIYEKDDATYEVSDELSCTICL